MTPSGTEPATFRFVAQHLNHCATAVPKKTLNSLLKQDTISIKRFVFHVDLFTPVSITYAGYHHYLHQALNTTSSLIVVGKKVKVDIEQAMNFQTGNRGITLLCL